MASSSSEAAPPSTPRVTSTSSSASSPASSTPAKSTGVSALKARFEAANSSPTAKSPTAPRTVSPASSRVPSNASSSSSSSRSARTSTLTADTTHEAETLPPVSLGQELSETAPTSPSTPKPEQSGVVELSPSVGAVSLIEPNTTIENPFSTHSAGTTPTVEESGFSAAQDAQPITLRSSVGDPMAGSSVWATGPSDSLSNDAYQDPATPSASSNARFSTISLSSATPGGQSVDGMADYDGIGTTSKRDTMTAPRQEPDKTPPSSLVRSPEAAARASMQIQERLRSHVDSSEHRASQEGVEKLKQEFERLHRKHGRSVSSASTAAAPVNDPASSTSPVIAEAPRTIDGSTQADDEQDGVDWEFWGRVMSNYQQVAQENPQELSRAIQAGIPAQLRGLCWQLLSASKDEEMEIIYAFYLRQTSSHEKQIRKDLSRTFPEQDYFKDGKGVGQENLFNVVKAYSLYDEECGYCQGMQFIVGPLLLNMPDEEAFSTLVRLMKSYGLRGHFEPNMPALQLRLFQFDRLLEDMLPLLHRHLVRNGVKTSMYASQWFMTLFSYRFPLDFVYRVLDSIFAEGIEAIFRFAVALMRRSEDALLELNFEGALEYLKGSQLVEQYKLETQKGGSEYDVNAFAQEAYAVDISPFTLDGYAAEFDEQVKAANAHRREVEALRLVNRNLSSKVASLEEQLQQINAEHVDLVKQVVMSKIAREEMEEELIRYKMQTSASSTSLASLSS